MTHRLWEGKRLPLIVGFVPSLVAVPREISGELDAAVCEMKTLLPGRSWPRDADSAQVSPQWVLSGAVHGGVSAASAATAWVRLRPRPQKDGHWQRARCPWCPSVWSVSRTFTFALKTLGRLPPMLE